MSSNIISLIKFNKLGIKNDISDIKFKLVSKRNKL